MADLLQQGAKWLAKTRAQHASRRVVVQRGSSSVTVRAAIGRSEFDLEDAQGVVMKVETKDFLILVGEYRLDAVPTVPQVSDRIIDGNPDTAGTYEVMPPAKGIPAWQYADPYRTTYRVHAKLIANPQT